jgi:hypothetical protein
MRRPMRPPCNWRSIIITTTIIIVAIIITITTTDGRIAVLGEAARAERLLDRLG